MTALTPINLRLAQILVLRFYQYPLNSELDLKLRPLAEFETSFRFDVDKKEKQVICFILVKSIIIQTKEMASEIEMSLVFDIEPFQDIIKVKGEEVEIPDQVVQNLYAVSISTLRGVLHEKHKGTILQNEIFPLIDPSVALKNRKIDN